MFKRDTFKKTKNSLLVDLEALIVYGHICEVAKTSLILI